MEIRQISDPFGLKRLSELMTLRRQEERQKSIDEQNAITQGLQQEHLRQGIKQGDIQLSELLKRQQVNEGLQKAIAENPDADPDLVTLQYYAKTNPDQAMEHSKKIFDLAGKVASVNPKAAVDLINKKTGLELKYEGTKGEIHTIHDPKNGKIYNINKTTGEMVNQFDIPKQKEDFTLGEGQVRFDESGKPIAYGKKKKDKAAPKERPFISALIASGEWFPSQGRITGPTLDLFEDAARKAAENGKPLTGEDLKRMEFDSVKNRSTGQTAGGRLTIARKQNIEAAYGLLDNIEKSGEKLNYPDLKIAGVADKWIKGQLNDPVLAEYMTQRADALFVLGNALKQNGLTDKAIMVEEEAANPTMSPKALKAWLKVQRSALDRAAEEMNKDFKFDIKTSGEGNAQSKKTVLKFDSSGNLIE